MRTSNLRLLLVHTFTELLKRPGTKLAIGLLNVLALFALVTAYSQLREQQASVNDYRQEVRERWEANPDKHPHRMAHYGYVAFREQHPLSFFDRGLDSYVGNAVFLEAHRQNTVNFSTASLSTLVGTDYWQGTGFVLRIPVGTITSHFADGAIPAFYAHLFDGLCPAAPLRLTDRKLRYVLIRYFTADRLGIHDK